MYFIYALAVTVPVSILTPFAFWAITDQKPPFGLPNWITLIRNILVAFIISIFMTHHLTPEKELFILGLSILFLTLDGLDGYFARKLNLCSDFGARFDMESDAFFILVLSSAIVLFYEAPAWVLMIGAMRYIYVFLQQIIPALKRPIKDRYSRKSICVFQTASLLTPLVPGLSSDVWIPLLMISLILLTFSFARDIFDQALNRGAGDETL